MKKMNEMNLAELKVKLKEIGQLKTQEIRNQQYEKAAQLRDEEKLLSEALAKLEKELK